MCTINCSRYVQYIPPRLNPRESELNFPCENDTTSSSQWFQMATQSLLILPTCNRQNAGSGHRWSGNKPLSGLITDAYRSHSVSACLSAQSRSSSISIECSLAPSTPLRIKAHFSISCHSQELWFHIRQLLNFQPTVHLPRLTASMYHTQCIDVSHTCRSTIPVFSDGAS